MPLSLCPWVAHPVDGAVVVSPVYRIPFSTTSSSCVEENLLADIENCFFAGSENYLIPSVVSRVSHPESDRGFLAPLVFWGGTANAARLSIG